VGQRRNWIGWWSIVLLLPIVVWLWFNPLIFPPSMNR